MMNDLARAMRRWTEKKCNCSSLISPDVSAPAALASLLSTLRSHKTTKLDDGWPESEKHVFEAALRMVVVKDSR